MDPDGALLYVASNSQNRFVGKGGGELEIGDRDGPVAMVSGDQVLADMIRERCAPEDGRRIGHGVKPNTAHPRPAGIAGANVGRGRRHEFMEPSGTLAQGVRQGPKIREAGVNVWSEPDTVPVTVAESGLQDRKQAPCAGEGNGH